jgi:hypothetical protein
VYAGECLNERLPIHKDLTFTLDKVNNSLGLLSLTLSTRLSILIQLRSLAHHGVRVSRTQERVQHSADFTRHHLSLNPIQALENLHQALVFLDRHGLANVFTKLLQLEPGHSGGLAGWQLREGGVAGL